jgi:glyoxylase-like metal-dependent hydrolase (beta-lactamase superfamily II)
MAQVERIVSGTWKENGYVVSSREDAVVIDPGGEFALFEEYVATNGLRVHAVINTHAHYDHLGAVAPIVAGHHAPFHLHPADEDLLQRANFYRTLFLGKEPIVIPKLDVPLADSTSLRFGSLTIAVLHTPGHTPGSVCFDIEGALFTGDTVMAEHLGRTDLPGGDRGLLVSSVELLARTYGPETLIRPGHGSEALLGDVLERVPALPELRG